MDHWVKENVKEFLEFLLVEAKKQNDKLLIEDIDRGLEQLETTGILIPF
ncbi:hypothetical protein [Inconstantimicrobium mannanitabidum]|uniref:Uncharacterized protein n=1 Tax=Inconstantimicrobium mannanitabidum TaxID=1604901 RepID=A0ACB5R9A3_9CLOT|nr:hypothetical protein [Clostridium sp. TW13]GKX65616.1 hypothetical protein rsdtw13_08740 [Clostridium sp. TW13]